MGVCLCLFGELLAVWCAFMPWLWVSYVTVSTDLGEDCEYYVLECATKGDHEEKVLQIAFQILYFNLNILCVIERLTFTKIASLT